MTTANRMKAYVLRSPGGPEALELSDVERPEPRNGEALIRVRAFGLNRSEWFTRNGDSPTVKLPRIIGIECVGEVVAAPGTGLEPGTRVAAMMGGMGRQYDGSYAEYTRVPEAHVFPLDTDMDWAALGGLPEMLQTTAGSLHTGLELRAGERLLIRGGTSSIGLAALAMASNLGASVTATSRSESSFEFLRGQGADNVLVDDGALAAKHAGKFHRVLELIGTETLRDSLRCTRPGGVVCMTGILGGDYPLPEFLPLLDIPNGVKLTSYSGGSEDITRQDLQRYVGLVANGELTVQRGPVFGFEDLHDAHRLMDANRARGKMVVVT